MPARVLLGALDSVSDFVAHLLVHGSDLRVCLVQRQAQFRALHEDMRHAYAFPFFVLFNCHLQLLNRKHEINPRAFARGFRLTLLAVSDQLIADRVERRRADRVFALQQQTLANFDGSGEVRISEGSE